MRVVRPAKKRSRFDEVSCLPTARSLPSPLRKSRHPSGVRGSSQKIALGRGKSKCIGMAVRAELACSIQRRPHPTGVRGGVGHPHSGSRDGASKQHRQYVLTVLPSHAAGSCTSPRRHWSSAHSISTSVGRRRPCNFSRASSTTRFSGASGPAAVMTIWSRRSFSASMLTPGRPAARPQLERRERAT
jgi:hypothetical protein